MTHGNGGWKWGTGVLTAKAGGSGVLEYSLRRTGRIATSGVRRDTESSGGSNAPAKTKGSTECAERAGRCRRGGRASGAGASQPKRHGRNRVNGAAALTTQWALPAAGTCGVLAGHSRVYYRTHRQLRLLRRLSARVGRGGVVDRRRLRRSAALLSREEVSGRFRKFPEASGRFKFPVQTLPEVSGSFQTLSSLALSRLRARARLRTSTLCTAMTHGGWKMGYESTHGGRVTLRDELLDVRADARREVGLAP